MAGSSAVVVLAALLVGFVAGGVAGVSYARRSAVIWFLRSGCNLATARRDAARLIARKGREWPPRRAEEEPNAED
jgi:hypothetical protein